MKLTISILCLLLPSCAFYRDKDGTVFAMAGTNAQSVSAGGLRMEGVNQTEAIDSVGAVTLRGLLIENGADVLKTGITEGSEFLQETLQ